jgi:hypothetical protein
MDMIAMTFDMAMLLSRGRPRSGERTETTNEYYDTAVRLDRPGRLEE